MKLKRIQVGISALVCSIVLGGAVTQSQTPDQPVNAYQSSCPDPIEVGEGVQFSKICPSYDKTRACAGEQDVPLKITIAGQGSLKLLTVSLGEGTAVGPSAPITFSESGRPIAKETVPAETDYNYKMNMSRDLKARKYQVKLDLQYPSEQSFPKYFWLRVCSDGGIRVSDDSPKEIKGFSGSVANIKLKLSNAFELFPINLHEIRITSNPPNLIEPAKQVRACSADESSIRLRDRDKPLTIPISLAAMTPGQLIYGFDDDAKITLEFVYDDGEVQLTDYKEIKLVEKPSVAVLLMAILLGVLAGSLIKLYMQTLPKQQLSNKERLWFVLGTAAVGVVLSLVAFFGEVQVVAFKLQGSYDNPKVLFIVSLGVTIIGLPLVYTIFRLSKSGGAGSEERSRP